MPTVVNLIGDLKVHAWKKYSYRHLSQIGRIVVHHFGGWISIEEAARMHVEDHGWPGIGYHIVIKDGTVHLTNSLDVISYGVKNNNTPTINIALWGKYGNTMPEPEDLDALQVVITSIETLLGQLPVQGHRNFKATECPGDCLYEWIVAKYGESPAELTISLSRVKKWWHNLWEGDKSV